MTMYPKLQKLIKAELPVSSEEIEGIYTLTYALKLPDVEAIRSFCNITAEGDFRKDITSVFELGVSGEDEEKASASVRTTIKKFIHFFNKTNSTPLNVIGLTTFERIVHRVCRCTEKNLTSMPDSTVYHPVKEGKFWTVELDHKEGVFGLLVTYSAPRLTKKEFE